MNKKSVLEQALLEAQQLEEAVKSNAKEILASTMKQEIEELVKESLNEQDEFVEDEIEDIEVPAIEDEDQEEEVSVDLPDDEEAMVTIDMDTDVEPLDLTAASDTEVLKVFKAMGADDGVVITQDDNVIDIEDQEAGTEYKIELAENKLKSYPFINEEVDDLNDDEMNLDTYIEAEIDLDEETLYEIDLDDDELGAHGELGETYDEELDEHEGEYEFTKHLGKSDQGYLDREADKEGALHGAHPGRGEMSDRTRAKMARGTRSFDLGEDEQGYNARLRDSIGARDGAESDFSQSLEDRSHESEGTEKFYGKRKYSGNKSSGQEIPEASRTLGFGREFDGKYSPNIGGRKAITNNRNLGESKSSKTNILKEVTQVAKKLQVENRNFKEKNKEYRKALIVFRDKLNEVAVFNANLAYSTKLFTEHTTTKQEKINILRRFDNVTTLTESKSLFKQILTDLSVKTKSLNESVRKNITRTPSGGSSINLIETKTYENPQITRMKEIMSKL